MTWCGQQSDGNTATTVGNGSWGSLWETLGSSPERSGNTAPEVLEHCDHRLGSSSYAQPSRCGLQSDLQRDGNTATTVGNATPGSSSPSYAQPSRTVSGASVGRSPTNQMTAQGAQGATAFSAPHTFAGQQGSQPPLGQQALNLGGPACTAWGMSEASPRLFGQAVWGGAVASPVNSMGCVPCGSGMAPGMSAVGTPSSTPGGMMCAQVGTTQRDGQMVRGDIFFERLFGEIVRKPMWTNR